MLILRAVCINLKVAEVDMNCGDHFDLSVALDEK